MDAKQVTTNEIMEFLQDHMVLKEEFNGLRGEFTGLRDQVQKLEVKVNQVKLDLIDAMDEKIGALKGDLVVMMRSEDKKLNSLVHLLAERKVLDDMAVHSILTMQPFPQLFVTH